MTWVPSGTLGFVLRSGASLGVREALGCQSSAINLQEGFGEQVINCTGTVSLYQVLGGILALSLDLAYHEIILIILFKLTGKLLI